MPATPPVTDWRARAACLDEDPELFFPSSRRGVGAYAVAIAKSVCRECPVRAACHDAAIEADEQYGIWGGVDMEEDAVRRHNAARTERRRQAREAGGAA